jgi:hypothetical protein
VALPLVTAALIAAVAAPLTQAVAAPCADQEVSQGGRCTADLLAPPGSPEPGPLPGEEAADPTAAEAGAVDPGAAEAAGSDTAAADPAVTDPMGSGDMGADHVAPDPTAAESTEGADPDSVGWDAMGADPTVLYPMGSEFAAEWLDTAPEPSDATGATGQEGIPGPSAGQDLPEWPAEQMDAGAPGGRPEYTLPGEGQAAEQPVAPANPDAEQGAGETVEHHASLLPALDGLPSPSQGVDE